MRFGNGTPFPLVRSFRSSSELCLAVFCVIQLLACGFNSIAATLRFFTVATLIFQHGMCSGFFGEYGCNYSSCGDGVCADEIIVQTIPCGLVWLLGFSTWKLHGFFAGNSPNYYFFVDCIRGLGSISERVRDTIFRVATIAETIVPNIRISNIEPALGFDWV